MLFFSLGSVFAFGEVENFRLKSNFILFLILSALISLFLLGVGNFFGAACQLCIAWFFPFLEPLQALTVFTKRIFFWRLVSWRFLVCVNSEIFQLQRHVYWIFFFTIGFSGVVLKVFVNPCLFPWVCHARLFCFFKLQSVSLWYSCSGSLNSFLDNTLIFQRCPILRGLLFTARKLWLALLFRKTCRRLFFVFLVEP